MRILLAIALIMSAVLILEKAHGAEAICGTAPVIFCDDFESGNLNVWQDGYNPILHAVTSTLANVYQGQKALQVTYPSGSDGGWLTRWFMPGYDHLFSRVYVKFENPWVGFSKVLGLYGNRTDNQWSGFGQAGNKPNGTDFFIAMLVTLNWYAPDPGEVIFYSYFPEMTAAPDGKYWGNYFYQNDPRERLQTGRWYCLELELQANTPGLRDGFQRMWIDGVLKGEVLNMRWRDTTALKINAFQLSFSASGSVTATERVWIDNVVVSTQEIGCAASNTPPAPPTGLTAQ